MPSLADAPLPFPPAALRGSKDSLWQDWQITPDDGVRSDKARKDQALKSFDTGAKPFSQGKKAADLAATEALALELDGLQDRFYADRRFKMLLVLQGTDTSGKDGTVRGVFARTSPLGVHTVGWKAPTEVERDHDYL